MLQFHFCLYCVIIYIIVVYIYILFFVKYIYIFAFSISLVTDNIYTLHKLICHLYVFMSEGPT